MAPSETAAGAASERPKEFDSSGHVRTLFSCFRAAAHKFKGCVLSAAVGGRAASCYQQKCEGTRYSEPKHIGINQRLGALI